MMKKMNKYMKRYNSYPVNIMNASKQTLRLFFLRRHTALRIFMAQLYVIQFQISSKAMVKEHETM